MTTNFDEVEAQLLEGSVELPSFMMDLKTKYDALNTQIAELEKQKEDIKTIASIQADQLGVSMFTINGVNAFGYISATRTNVDTKTLAEKYPEVAAVVVTHVATKRFYSKKIVK